MASIPVPATPSAAGEPMTLGWRRAAFFSVFNLRTLAATFYMALLIALLSGGLEKLLVESAEDALFFTAYITRQTLISAVLVLLAMALADASLPRAMDKRRRAVAVSFLIALGAFGSTPFRLYFGRGVTMTSTELLNWVFWVGLIWTIIGVFGYLILSALREDDADRQALEQARTDEACLSAQMIEANLSALQAQIEPHFLFNTLANVRRLYEIDAGRGRQMLHHLVDYLRAALPSMRSAGSTLARELDLVRSYLTILQLRMGERLQFSIDAGNAPQHAVLPPMVLPTLVENSIKHGLSSLPEGGQINIQARLDARHLVVEVADTGCGFSGSSGSGVGLANTRARLAALYGSEARLQLRNNAPRGVVAEVRVPFQQPAAA